LTYAITPVLVCYKYAEGPSSALCSGNDGLKAVDCTNLGDQESTWRMQHMPYALLLRGRPSSVINGFEPDAATGLRLFRLLHAHGSACECDAGVWRDRDEAEHLTG